MMFIMSSVEKKRLTVSPTLWATIKKWGSEKNLNKLEMLIAFGTLGIGSDITITAIKGEKEKFTLTNPSGDSKVIWLIPEEKTMEYYNSDFAVICNSEKKDFFRVKNQNNPKLTVTEKVKIFSEENVTIKQIVSWEKSPIEITWNISYPNGEFSSIEVVAPNETIKMIEKINPGIFDFLSVTNSDVKETSKNLSKIVKGIINLTVNYYFDKSDHTYFNQIVLEKNKTRFYQIAVISDEDKKLFRLYYSNDWSFKSTRNLVVYYNHESRNVSFKDTLIPYLDLANFKPYNLVKSIEDFVHQNMDCVFE